MPLDCDTGLEARPFGGGDKNKKEKTYKQSSVRHTKGFENSEDVNSILVRTIMLLIN